MASDYHPHHCRSGSDSYSRGSTTVPNTPAKETCDDDQHKNDDNNHGNNDNNGHDTKNDPQNDNHGRENDINHHGDFARLIPQGRLARLAFSQIVQDGLDDPTWNPHARRFIHVGPRMPLPDDGHGHSSSDLETDASFSSSPSPSPSHDGLVWTGYFRLNMDIPPDNSSFGWILGCGRASKVVDLLLCRQKTHNVAGRHARFLHHKVTNQLMVYSDGRRVLLEGKDEILLDKRALTKPVTGISFGDLTYTIVFTNLSAEIYSRQIARYRERVIKGSSSSPQLSFLTPTPGVTDFDVQNYSIKSTIAKGSTCIVLLAIDRRTGDAVAIKRMNRDARNKAHIEAEINILKLLKTHHRICQLVDLIYLGNNSTHTQHRAPLLDEAYLVFLPVARSHLGTLISSSSSSSLPTTHHTTILHQCLSALTHIHRQSLMHRDIKPANIGILTLHPTPNIILLDFGVATFAPDSTDHTAGTIPYLAPEVIGLKFGESTIPYTKAVDVWSLGLTTYQLITGSLGIWKWVNRGAHEDLCALILELSKSSEELSPIAELVGRMIRWDVDNRCTAEQAVLDMSTFPGVLGVDGVEMAQTIASVKEVEEKKSLNLLKRKI